MECTITLNRCRNLKAHRRHGWIWQQACGWLLDRRGGHAGRDVFPGKRFYANAFPRNHSAPPLSRDLVSLTPACDVVEGLGDAVNTKVFADSARCRFSNRRHPSFAWTHNAEYNAKGVPVDAVLSCEPPPSVEGTVGIGGMVTAWLSLDEGQHWLQPALNYTYLCAAGEYYIPGLLSFQGKCKPRKPFRRT